MTKRGALLLLDTGMLSSFAVLMSWRLTGVWLHEAIGIALIAMIAAHLVVHWSWVESRIAIMTRPSQRRFGALLLNAALFAAMGTTIVTGLAVSKVAIPNRLTPASYLHWHSVHESAATLTVLLLGLHVAYNWDRIRGGLRRVFAAPVRSANLSSRSSGVSYSVIARRLAWVVLASTVLTGIVWTGVRLSPGKGEVLMRFADGHQELRAPPADITKVRVGTLRPAPAAGLPRFLVSFVLLLIVAAVGRLLHRSSAHRRRAGREGFRASHVGARLVADSAGREVTSRARSASAD
ncbi:MAG TPA: DUF4405 domain-containing protein [Gemmatimonadaceae bacterium]